MARAAAAGLRGSLVTAWMWNSAVNEGSLTIVLMTEPPWLPVAPKTTRIFLEAMSSFDLVLLNLGWMFLVLMSVFLSFGERGRYLYTKF